MTVITRGPFFFGVVNTWSIDWLANEKQWTHRQLQSTA